MSLTTIKTALLAAILTVGTSVAHATTITFNEFMPDDNHYAFNEGSTFKTGGYDFRVTNGGVWFVNMSGYSNTSRNGTTNLDLGATVSITNPSNKQFSVTSIDLATTLALETSWVSFTGTHVNGKQTTEVFTVNNAASNPYGFVTTNLTGFDHLTSFEMKTIIPNPESGGYWTLIDNIVINQVPEPSTWALFGLGLIMVAGLKSRKS